MTKEQWLVYIYGIYPSGGWTLFWGILALCWIGLLIVYFIELMIDYDSDNTGSPHHPSRSGWHKLGKKKYLVSLALGLMIFLSNLVPNRDIFMAIVATPYAVEGGKTIIDDIRDPGSKLSRLNKILDLSLDKAIEELEK